MPDRFPDRLKEGYNTFRSDAFPRERQRYDALAAGGQKPTIMIIACCDSRAAPEIVFDASPGEVFVVRNVANLVPPYAPDGKHHSTSAALEFAVLQLGVEHIVIMGHGRCGGISAVVNQAGPLEQW
jgi:carbonic anhydrase